MTKHKKILFLIQLPPPVHGVSVTNEKIIQSQLLRESDIKIDVLPLVFSKKIEEIDKLSYKKIIRTFGIALKLFSKCLFNRPKCVYFTLSIIGNTFYRDVLYVAILKVLRINIIYHLHRVGVNEAGKNNAIRHFLYKWVFSKTQVIHLTPRLYNDISNYVSPQNCLYVFNGIDDPLIAQNSSYEKQSNSAIQFTFLSHMVVDKGVVVLLEALVELNNRGINFTAKFAGGRMDEACKSAFDNLVPQNKLEDKIDYIGPVYDDAKNALYQNTDVFVFPSLYDSFGIVLLEAMAFSLPVIATIQGGIPDVVEDGETGYLVPKRDVQALADKMELLANDEVLRNKMGANGRHRFESNYTSDRFEIHIVQALQSCLENVS